MDYPSPGPSPGPSSYQGHTTILGSPAYNPLPTLPTFGEYGFQSHINSRPTRGPGSRGGRIIQRGMNRGRARGGRGSRGGPGRGARGNSRARGRGLPPSDSSRQSSRISQIRTTQSDAPLPRLNLKLSFKSSLTNEAAGGRMMSFLGEYDRDVDEEPIEPLAFEEQFILRVPKEIADGPKGLREMIRGKAKLDAEMKFLDSRRAAFKHGSTSYAAKLVDLPNIIEAQKTLDNRHLFKIADISQMLVVTEPITSESSITAAPLKVDDYIWPHGLTPPLRHVRKRRFRKRLSRRAIENVEEQVEELLKKDGQAEATAYDLIEAHPDPDIDDSYYINWSLDDPYGEYDEGSEVGSEMYQEQEEWPEEEEEGEEVYSEGEEDDLDQELAAALRDDQSDESAHSGSDGISEEEDDDDEDKSDDDDDETQEQKAKIKQFTSEIKQLETAIEKKRAGFTGGNPIMMKRFEETIAGLQTEINTKMAARQVLLAGLEQKDVEQQDSRHETPHDSPHDSPHVDSRIESRDSPFENDSPQPHFQRDALPAPQNSSPPQEDLFGDDDDEAYYQPEAEEAVDEMAAMLMEEMSKPMDGTLGDPLADTLELDPLGIDAIGEPLEPETDLFPMEEPLDEEFDSLAGILETPLDGLGIMPVEGGVGRRRLASGVDESDEDSDDSDD